MEQALQRPSLRESTSWQRTASSPAFLPASSRTFWSSSWRCVSSPDAFSSSPSISLLSHLQTLDVMRPPSSMNVRSLATRAFRRVVRRDDRSGRPLKGALVLLSMGLSRRDAHGHDRRLTVRSLHYVRTGHVGHDERKLIPFPFRDLRRDKCRLGLVHITQHHAMTQDLFPFEMQRIAVRISAS